MLHPLLSACLSAIVVNEVSDRGSLATCGGADWVEVANSGSAAQDLQGWKLCDSDGCADVDALTLSGTLDAGAYRIFCGDVQPRWIGASDTITLHDANGVAVDSSGTLGGEGAFGKTWARQPDKTGPFAYTYLPTPGEPNGGAGTAPTSAVVVNEVSDKGTNDATCASQDWVELKNIGAVPVDLGGYMLCDERGCDELERFVFPAPSTIAAGGYLLACGGGTEATPSKFRFGIGGRDSVSLHSATGIPLSTSGTLPGDGERGRTWARSPDGTGAFVVTHAPTPGAAFGGTGTALSALQAVHDEGMDWFGVDAQGISVPDSPRVVDVYLSLTDESLAYLRTNSTYEQYVPATWSSGGATLLHQVGVRPRGYSSLFFAECMGTPKMPFQIDFNKYAGPQRFHGVKEMYLRGGFSDPSSLRDWFGARLLARFGLPHVRGRHVRLHMNGEYLGLYLAMEAWPSEPMLAKLMPQYNVSDHQLYKHKVGASGLMCADLAERSTEALEATLNCNDDNEGMIAAAAQGGVVLPRGCPDVWPKEVWCSQVWSLCPVYCGACEPGESLRDSSGYEWNRGEHKMLTESFAGSAEGGALFGQCGSAFWELAVGNIQPDRTIAYLRSGRDCAAMLLSSRQLDYEMGRSRAHGDARMTAFVNFLNAEGVKTAAQFARYVNVENWLKTLAFYATVISSDSPIMNPNNFFLFDLGDGSGYRIGVWDLDGAGGSAIMDILCGQGCGQRAIDFSISRPTCRQENHFFKPFLDDPIHYRQYLGYVREFASIYSDASLRDELVDVGRAIREPLATDQLVLRMTGEDDTGRADWYADRLTPDAAALAAIVARGAPASNNVDEQPYAAAVAWRAANVQAQLNYLDEYTRPYDAGQCPAGRTSPLVPARRSVTFNLTLAGNVATFDATAFKANLARGLPGVTANDITLRVVAASVHVTATVSVRGALAAQYIDATVDALRGAPASLSALLGPAVTIEALDGVAVPVPVSPSPSPPSPSPSPNDEADAKGSSSSSSGLVIGVAGGGAALVLIGAVFAACRHRRRNASGATEGAGRWAAWEKSGNGGDELARA